MFAPIWRSVLVLSTLSLAACASEGERTIAAKDMRKHVQYLADDALRGREAGRPGIETAEEYIAGKFAEYGLKPLPGQSGLMHEFTLYRPGYDPASKVARVDGENSDEASIGVDMRPFPFSDDGEVEAAVVFAGYGIVSEEHDWDDYAGLDVEGKWVFVLRHEPGENDEESPFDGTESTTHASFGTKARKAADRGAAGMILVTDPLHHSVGDDLRSNGRLSLTAPGATDDDSATGDEEKPFLAVHVSKVWAERLVKGTGKKLSDIQTALDAGTPASEFVLGEVRVRGQVKTLDTAEEVSARNVIGFLEGSDPKLKDEWLVVGAHHDHVGAFGGEPAGGDEGSAEQDTVFNGADDNASGVSGVLELAQAFGSKKERPLRSMVFTTFSAEEKGLLGSKAMMEEGVIPAERAKFMFNLDMIGRNPDRNLVVFGDGYVRGLRELVETVNSGELSFEFAGTGYEGNSDHDSFYQHDIPFMFFFTGLHPDYHGLGDHPEKLAYDRMQSLVSVAYRVLDSLGRVEKAPAFVHHINWLGLQVEWTGAAGAGQIEVTGVEDGSRAQQVGFEKGDVLTKIGDEVLGAETSIGELFRSIEPGSERAIEVRRAAGPVRMEVARARTGYMGVFPAALDEDVRDRLKIPDNEGILLRQVSPEGPSAKAGLKEGDIVLRVSGQPVSTSTLSSRLSQVGAGETVTMLVLRDGERLEIPVTLGERPQRRR